MILALLATALAMPVVEHDSLKAFDRWLDDAADTLKEQATYTSPTEPMRMAALAGVARLAGVIETCEGLDAVAEALAPAELDLTVHQVDTQRFVRIADMGDRGSGWTLWRCGEASDLIVQAPHAFFDLQTGTLVRRGFLYSDARGATFNTVHRYRAHPDEVPEDELHPADSTRQPASMLHSIAIAWMASEPDARAVQLHGFGSGSADADAVLSTGSAAVAPIAARDALAEILSVDVAAFGADVQRLGARNNVLGKALARTPGRFLHVELAREVRRTLARDRALVAAVLTRLGEIPWDS